MLLGSSRRLLVVYKVNPHLQHIPSVKSLRIRCQYECQFTKASVKVESVDVDTYYFEVCTTKDNLEIIEFILVRISRVLSEISEKIQEFEVPNAADDIVAIKWDRRFLEIVAKGKQKHQPATPLVRNLHHLQRPVHHLMTSSQGLQERTPIRSRKIQLLHLPTTECRPSYVDSPLSLHDLEVEGENICADPG